MPCYIPQVLMENPTYVKLKISNNIHTYVAAYMYVRIYLHALYYTYVYFLISYFVSGSKIKQHA